MNRMVGHFNWQRADQLSWAESAIMLRSIISKRERARGYKDPQLMNHDKIAGNQAGPRTGFLTRAQKWHG